MDVQEPQHRVRWRSPAVDQQPQRVRQRRPRRDPRSRARRADHSRGTGTVRREGPVHDEQGQRRQHAHHGRACGSPAATGGTRTHAGRMQVIPASACCPGRV